MGSSYDIISSSQAMIAEESLLLRVLGVVLYLVNWTAVNYVSTSIIMASVFIGTWLLYSLTYTPPIPTEDGVPYIVSIFAENSAGNGTKCNVTDFTNELRKKQSNIVFAVLIYKLIKCSVSDFTCD